MKPRLQTPSAAALRRARPGSIMVPGLSLLVLGLGALGLLMLCACGGSGSTTAGSPRATPSGSVSASQATTPSVASAPVRLLGSDSVAVTKKVVGAERAALRSPTAAKLVRPYADDVVGDDYAFGAHFEGRAAVRKMFRKNVAEYSGARWVAGYAGRGWAVIEQRWDFTKNYGGTIELIVIQETRGGKIVHEGDYYQTIDNLPDGKPLTPVPLKSAPRTQDTAAAAEAVALKYAAALQAKDAAAAAALSAPTIAFMDTASSTSGSSPGDVQAYYDGAFKVPADLAFTHLRYALGCGWAAVIWTAESQSFGVDGDGVTMLEIRDDKIARETLYYTSTNVPFAP